MDQSKKIIQINKDYLNPKQNKPKTQKKKNIIPISPRLLQNKYLKKFKNNKNNEIKNNKSKVLDNVANSSKEDEADEFKKSLDFISNFSKGHNISKNKTIKNKNHTFELNDPNIPPVLLDLPEELLINSPNSNINLPELNLQPSPSFTQTSSIIHNQTHPSNVSNDVPYGCLKNGTKPTYRTWNKTIKRQPSFNNNVNDNSDKKNDDKNEIQKSIDNLSNLSKEQRIKNLKQKILKNNSIKPTEKVDKKKKNKQIKKTITKKFTLGKSKNGNYIGILIKDKKTRKKILDAKKEMKKTDISEIKNYLHKHGLIKVGSTAPANIVRTMYESSRLSGDLVNNEEEILLHNYLNDK